MDLTPEPHEEDQERSDELELTSDDIAAGVRALANYGPDLYREDLEAIAKVVLSRAARGIREAAYRAGREDAAREVNIDKIRRAARHLCARIIASAHLLDVPFTDAPDQSPWTKAKRDMAALYEAVGIRMADDVSCCTCPDCDVTAFNEKPGSRTVKGLDPACPVHGSRVSEGEG